jgi:hypothetical protein
VRPLWLYTVFHLNLAYSSIEEEQRAEVLARCYWPLLRLARKHRLALGIEAPAATLEAAAALDPGWIAELKDLVQSGACELVGSGLAQIIGPLVPAAVNAANLRLGQAAYERLLGQRPTVALVNEQAYASGLVPLYLAAGFRALVMEWDNPAHEHPEWKREWRYLPQYALGPDGSRIALLWNKSIAFQKLQRYAHGELERAEYLAYLEAHLSDAPRAFPLYGNDVEIFDFRPGRYQTEAAIHEPEWERLDELFAQLAADARYRFVRPSQVLELLGTPGAGGELALESPAQPVPVKKQGKYNLTRWAVTGRDDIGINTACYRLFEALEAREGECDDDWRELCYLWSSDFRTHITQKRWTAYRERLSAALERLRPTARPSPRVPGPSPSASAHRSTGRELVQTRREGRYLVLEGPQVLLRLNCRRGLAIDALRFGGEGEPALVGTLPHGYYDDIALGADYYTGHLVLEAPGRPKITDLEAAEPQIEVEEDGVVVRGTVPTPLGPVRKLLRLSPREPRLDLEYELSWSELPHGSLRLGHLTLLPEAFHRAGLFYRTRNGGPLDETFPLAGRLVEHGAHATFLVSASQGLGMTSGRVDLGDGRRGVRVEVDKQAAAAIGLITYREIAGSFFCRLALSVREMDETCRPHAGPPSPFCVKLCLKPLRAGDANP